MPTTYPVSTVIVEILKHTPSYVWVILAVLVVLGLRQMRDQVVSRARLAIAPVALGAYSLWGATLAFGVRIEVVAAWGLGIAIAIAANRWVQWPRNVRPQGTGFAVRGSPWPLIAMLAVFMLRYAVAVTLAFHHELGRDPVFGLALALLYGALSGLFTARALRILRSGAGTTHGLAAA